MRVNMPRGCYRGVFSVSNLNSPKFGRTRIDERQGENVSSFRETSRENFAGVKNVLVFGQQGCCSARNIATTHELLLNLDENRRQNATSRVAHSLVS